jgi:hypothetical protein
MQMAHDKLAKIFTNFKFRGFLMDMEGNCIELKIKDKLSVEANKEN